MSASIDVRLSGPGHSNQVVLSHCARPVFARHFLLFLFVVIIEGIVAQAQVTTTFRSPLVYGYQADPMMVTYNGHYYLFVDDQLPYDRLRTSTSIAGLASAESQVVWSPASGSGVAANAGCAYIFHWSSKWYQYCGDSTGNFVIQSSGDNPLGPYTFMSRINPPQGFTGYAAWPIQVGSQIYMLITTNGMGISYNSIYAAKFSDPGTQSGAWSPIAVPTGGSGSWECANGRCIDEGGSAVVHGNKVFLLFSAGGYESPDYCVGMLSANTASDLTQTSSWIKSNGCVVSRNNATGAYGPGSMIWFKSPDGTQDWVVYHVKTNTSNDTNGGDRKLEAQQVTWDNNGNPVFGAPYALDTYRTLPSGDPGRELSAAAVSSWSSDRLTTHVIGAGNQIWENYWSSAAGWSNWHTVGAVPPNGAALGPAAVSRVSNYIDMFVPTNNAIYTQYWDGSLWHPWASLGGPAPSCCLGSAASSRATVATYGGNQLNVFTLGLDHNVWEMTWTSSSGWGSWQNSPGALSVGAIGAPAAYSRISNYIDLFVRGSDGNLYTNYWNGSTWNGWTNFGAVPSGNASSPALASWSSGNLTVYERGQNGNIYQQAWNGSWSGTWTNLGAPSGGAVSDPAAYSRTNNYVDVFVRGSNDHIWTSFWNGSSWSSWADFGEP